MQYIQKKNKEPDLWNSWFTIGEGEIRSYDFKKDEGAFAKKKIKSLLIDEQCGLCAFCQQTITVENSSIEHIVPKEHNPWLSTHYHNLVAVCSGGTKDEKTGRFHCDKSKLNKPIVPFIFLSNCEVSATKNNPYFLCESDGSVLTKQHKDGEIRKQVEAFIEIMNLNHSNLKQRRAKDALDGIIAASNIIDKDKRRSFWESQFKAILGDTNRPFRQFLLVYIGKRIGIN